MGCGPIEELVTSLSDMLDGQCVTTVICGNNKRLKNKLMGICDEQDGFRILGYTSDVPTLLTSADIFITKPGGLSVSEAYAKKVPMVFVDTVGGCESYNRDFFTSLGCATAATKDENAAEICFELINSKNALKKMNEAFTSPTQNAAKIIHDSLLS
jgi:processive 1,2-diacylglycerol beta-glucosyltransferase